jgi:diguanylate cyclase (GGDEF)-like protein
MGGEEFLLIFKGCDINDAEKVAEDLRTSVSACFARSAILPHQVTISLGVAEYSPDETLEKLLSRTDQALYQAKHAGRDRVCLAGTTAAV